MNYVPRFIAVALTFCTIASAQVQRVSHVDKTHVNAVKDTVYLACPPYAGYRGAVKDGTIVMSDTTVAGFDLLPPYIGHVVNGKVLGRMTDAPCDSVQAYMQYVMHDGRIVTPDSTFLRGTASAYAAMDTSKWIFAPIPTTTPRPYALRIITVIADADTTQGHRTRWAWLNEAIIHQDF